MEINDASKFPQYGDCSNSTDQQTSQMHDEAADESLTAALDPVILHLAEEIQRERFRFQAAFLELQNPRNSSGRLIYVYVRRELQNFHLDGLYREAIVLNEAFIRGLQRIAAGETINKPEAWIRGAAFRIIRELHRDQQKLAPFEDYLPEAQKIAAPDTDLEAELNDDFNMLRLAFQMLSAYDQQLLNLRVVEERSWREICDLLRQDGIEPTNEAALRKRKERALIRLRKQYHKIKLPEFS